MVYYLKKILFMSISLGSGLDGNLSSSSSINFGGMGSSPMGQTGRGTSVVSYFVILVWSSFSGALQSSLEFIGL